LQSWIARSNSRSGGVFCNIYALDQPGRLSPSEVEAARVRRLEKSDVLRGLSLFTLHGPDDSNQLYQLDDDTGWTPMITVGSFEAKTRLSALLEQVAAGDVVTITKHGRPIARLTKVQDADRDDVGAAIDALKALRGAARLDGLDWKSLRDEGRR